MVGAVEQRVVPKFLRKDIGGGYCVHVGLRDGQLGFSKREPIESDPARPNEPDAWLTDAKVLDLYRVVGEFVRSKGLISEPTPTPTPQPAARSVSPFFQMNIDEIMALKGGYLRTPPALLRPFYSAVVTRDRYRDD